MNTKFSEIVVAGSAPSSADTLIGVTAAGADRRFIVSGVIRTRLTANTNFYVAITGADSNAGTIGSPWRTLQHAMDFISSSIDFAGFIITVNIAAGTFAGFGVKSTTGGGILYFKGAGSGLTTVTDGPNDGIFNFGECISIAVGCGSSLNVNALTLVNSGNLSYFRTSLVAIYVPAITFSFNAPDNLATDILLDCTGQPDTTQSIIVNIEAQSSIFDQGLTVKGGGATIFLFFNIQNLGYYANGTSTISGNLTCDAGLSGCFASAALGGTINQWTATPWTVTGTVTGQRFIANQGFINNTFNLNTFPGNVAGQVFGGGSYS